MMANPGDSTQELAERYQRLADTQTAGSHPWPGMGLALRRSQRRRLAGMSALTAVSVVLGGALYAQMLEPTTRSSAPAASSSAAPETLPRDGLGQLKQAGYGGPTSGSLGGDQDWLNDVRERVRQLAKQQPIEAGKGWADLASADEVLVRWAGELGGTRYVLAFYASTVGFTDAGSTEPSKPSFVAVVLAGPAGAAAEALTIRETTTWSEAYSGPVVSAITMFVQPADPRDPLLAFVTGLKVTGVKVATARHFTADGELSTDWRELRRDGSVWIGELNEAERYLWDLQIKGADSQVSNRGPESPVIARLGAIAAAGTDRQAADCAGEATNGLGGSIVDQPWLATSTRLDSDDVLGAAVLRSPDGPFVVSFCRAHLEGGKEFMYTGSMIGAVVPAPEDSGSLLAVIEDPDPSGADALGGYLVVAPVGADTVRIGKETVKVRNRLAHFDYADDRAGGVTVQALDRAGKVIATARSVLGH
jgi:hypothetical protein